MRQIAKILLLLLIASTCGAAEPVKSLIGTWKSPFGAIYESDGTNFVCRQMPDALKEEFGHWIHKNRLTDIVVTDSGIEANEFLRWGDGRTQMIPSKIIVEGDSLTIVYFNKDTNYIRRVIFEKVKGI